MTLATMRLLPEHPDLRRSALWTVADQLADECRRINRRRTLVIRQLIRDACPPADVRQVYKPADDMTGGKARICR